MQVLDVQPTNPTPYTPAGGTYNNNPQLGSSGLPALSGLTNNMNPMAQELQAQGRGEDSMLVHMTPGEVNSLRGLAQQFGGDLTMNPNTGLPEAGWLGKLLPTILGVAGAAVGIPTWAIGLGVGAGGTAVTGDLNKGLMAGLQAFGGASLASGFGVGPGAESAVAGAAPEAAVNLAPGAATPALTVPADIVAAAAPAAPVAATTLQAAAPTLGQTIATQAPQTLLTSGAGAGAGAAPGFLDKFGAAAREGMKAGTLPYKIAPYAAGLGTLSAISDVTTPEMRKYEGEEDKWKYEGPYMPMPRRLRPRVEGEGEISFFEESNPYPGFLTRTGDIPTGYAEGGQTLSMGKPSGSSGAPTIEEQYAMFKEVVPMEQRQSQGQFAGDANAYRLMTEGLVDPATGVRSQFSGTVAQYRKPGDVESFGNNFMRLGEDMRWHTVNPNDQKTTDIAAIEAFTTAAKNRAGSTAVDKNFDLLYEKYKDAKTRLDSDVYSDGTYKGGNISPTMGGVTPGGGTGATVSEPRLSPGATASGYGAEVLAEKYTPSFTQKADFTTAPAKANTVGSEMLANLGTMTSQFQTSPGAITASRTYPGGSPSQRIRAAAQANAAAGATPSPVGEIDYGIPKAATTNPYTDGTAGNPFAGINDYLATFWSQYGNPYAASTSTTYSAKGGEIRMDDGAFVVDARTVSELGNGSSSAGQELLARLGGRPVRGPGDGVSDSIPANIGGVQEARVARDEVIIPAEAVRKLGGAKKLYALMDKAHKARKKAKRGEDTKVAKGLGALR